METYRIIVFIFFILDKDNKEMFFKESFLLADFNPDIVLKMLFLIMNSIDIDFQAQDFQWRSYTIGEILLTTKQIELIGKKKFATIALNLKYKAFIIYVAILNIDLGDIVHPSKET